VDFATLALVCLAGLAGPLLAFRSDWPVPVVVGELLAGVLLGPTVFDLLRSEDPTFTLLADVGFALVMFVVGSHVPVRSPELRGALRIGVLRAAAVGVVAAALAVVVALAFGTGHAALYAVLMASSSAALILPVSESLRLTGRPVLQLLPQVAVADTACIVALPLVMDPPHALRAALGSAAVLACAGVSYLVLRELERRGIRKRAHRLSERRKFALELRVILLVLFALAALATRTHVSILLAGFALGVVVAAIGEPRRLVRQLFAVTEGFFGPLFFVWLGASLNLRALGDHPSFILIGLLLGLGAVAAHAVPAVFGQRLSMAVLASAQLGIPVAAATIGTQSHLLHAGEAAALLLGALVTIVVGSCAGVLAARRGLSAPDPQQAPVAGDASRGRTQTSPPVRSAQPPSEAAP
jgi:Kef-type K+ transport system membrane component KefB